MIERRQLTLNDVVALIEGGDKDRLRSELESIHPSDVAVIIEQLSDDDRLAVFGSLAEDFAIDVFEHLPTEIQEELLTKLSDRKQARLIDEMSPDDRIDLLAELPDQMLSKLLSMLRREERRDVAELIQFDPHTAGGIMTTEFAHLPGYLSVQEAIERLRGMADKKETIRYIYVVDENDILVGYLHIEDLVFSDPSQRIDQIMRTDVISVDVDLDQEEVASICRQYDIDVVPVTDATGRLRGIVTFDDVMDVLQEEAQEDIHKISAVEAMEMSYFNASVSVLVRKRVTWLGVLLILGTISGSVLKAYSAVIESVVGLSYFVPMLLGTGGNTGAQAAGMMIRELSVHGEIGFKGIIQVFRKELFSGLLLGGLLSFLAVARTVWLIGEDLRLTITVVFTLVCVILIGTMSGAFLPIIARKIRLDPAVVSGPLVSTLVDVLGLTVYFEIAKMVIGLGH